MADWDEIKKLAADFQRTQTSDTLQRISERNCIDIIKKLSELKLLDLIYTCDGKEFVTPSHLLKEIQDEIHVNGGRMHLHDLASLFNVDYQHIEAKAQELAKSSHGEYIVVLGQVIHSSYRDNLAREINERLQLNGQITTAELSKTIDLPTDFLLDVINERIGTYIDGVVANHDPRTFYTTQFISQYRAKIVGALSGVSRPTSLASLLKRLDIPERVFIQIAESLIKEGRIDATIQNRLFIPSVYARHQNEFIENFFKQNSYIEYEVVSRMDIQQPKTFLRKKFPNAIMLDTCCVSPLIIAQIESEIEECIVSNGWVDLTTIVSSVLSADDIEMLVQQIFKGNKQYEASCLLFEHTNLCSLGFVATCKNLFTDMMEPRAQQDLRNGILLKHFVPTICKPEPIPTKVSVDKDTEANKSSTKVEDDGDKDAEGGGKRGRQKGKGQKSSATADEVASSKRERERERKSKRRSKRSTSPDDINVEITKPRKERELPLIFKQVPEICKDLMHNIEDGRDIPSEVLESIATLIWNDLNTAYRRVSREVFEEALRKASEEGEQEQEEGGQEQEEQQSEEKEEEKERLEIEAKESEETKESKQECNQDAETPTESTNVEG